MDRSRVVVAEVLRSRGNRGEVIVRSQTDVPGRLENLRHASLRLADGADRQVEIENAWRHKDHWVLKLAGVDSIGDAETLAGADLWVPQDDRGALPDGEFFQSDLVGFALRDRRTKQALGRVEGWQQYGGPPLMEANVDGREVLIPFVPAICYTVDLEARVIELEIPEGLLDL